MLGKVNEDPATLADQSNIGGPTVHLSATSQLPKQRTETEFVKELLLPNSTVFCPNNL
jgi:hypothetical protein